MQAHYTEKEEREMNLESQEIMFS